MYELRRQIISVDNMLGLTFERIQNPSNNKTLADIIGFDTTTQLSYKPGSAIAKDPETKLGVTGFLRFTDDKGNEQMREQIYFKKYLK
jgi:hypothetical protein